MAFFVKITPPLTSSSSEPLVENVVSVVSVVSQNRILGKNRYLFLPSLSPVFVLFKVPFSSSQSPVPVLLKLLFHPLQVLSHPPIPLPSSPIPVPVLSPPPLSQRKQRNDTKPSRRSRGGVVGSKMEHYSSHPPRSLLGTTLTLEPRWWRSRLRHHPQWRLPHWCQG